MAVSKRLRFEVFRRDAFRCRYCGRTATETELQVDHVVPETLGGNDDPANLVTACNTCNAGKSSAPLDGPVVAQVDHRIDSAVRAMQADDWSPGFTKADLGKGCGHGVGCEDDLCQLTSAAALAMYIRVTDRDEAAQLFEESALLDVADVDDDEFLELVA